MGAVPKTGLPLALTGPANRTRYYLMIPVRSFLAVFLVPHLDLL